ncbi:MAG: VWA domain-containing protein [Chloroflexi bacterium]|nr:VWA domain-containing protein [Chloroflexota bacterium]
MSFTTPLALLLLLAIPYAVWLGRPRPRAVRQGRAWVSLGLRLVILLGLILSLAGAQAVRTADNLAVVFLVDVSDSMSVEQVAQAEAFVGEAIAQMDPQRDQAAVILFGGNALVERPMSSATTLSPFSSIPQTLNSNMAEAIRLGLALYPAGSARRMVILSDGVATAGDSDEAARLAAASGVQIDYVALPRRATTAEAWVSNVSAPTRVTQGELFSIDITAESTADTPATLRVLAGGQIVLEQAVDLRVGLNNFRIPLQATAPEFARYTVQLTAAQDTFYQNNQLAAFTEITGPPRVLIVGNTADSLDDNGEPLLDEAPQLIEALRLTGLEVDRITPADLPSSLAELSNYASIVLVDVTAKALTPRKMEALQSYVRDLGGGLVAVGGPSSFGMGGYFKTPLEETLPVNMQIEDEERFPSVNMVIVIDRSGSMSQQEGGLTKIQLAAEGAARVVELLNDFDFVTVIPVDTGPSGQIGPTSLTDRDRILEQIRGISSGGGGIYVRTGLEAAQEALAENPTQVKHIIVLADGSDSEEKEGVPELLDELVADGVTVTMVAIGSGPDVQWLQDMALRGNGRFHFTDRAANLPLIFTQETAQIQRTYLVEERFFPTLVTRSPIINGIAQVPPLYGYVGVSAKDAAQVILETHLQDPLLASWQYGLGRSVAWTSDATGRWGTEWVDWQGFPVFWTQAVRWTISQGRNNTVESVITLSEGSAQLVVDVRSPEGGFLNDLPLVANVVAPDGQPTELTLQQVAPGRYAAEFAPASEGAYFVRVAGGTGEDGEPAVGQTSGWVLGYSPEYLQFDPNPQLLGSIAVRTNGRNLGEIPTAAFDHNLPVDAVGRPIWPWLLLVAVILLPFDIGVRRVIITRQDWARAYAASVGRLLGRSAEPVEHERQEQLSTLFQAKQRAHERRPNQPPTGDSSPPPSGGEPPRPIAPPTPPKQTPPAPPPSDTGSLASRLMDKKRKEKGE